MATIDNIFSKLFSSCLIDQQFTICWHSGEPLLTGIEFYRKVIQVIHNYNHHNIYIDHNFQTNGTKRSVINRYF